MTIVRLYLDSRQSSEVVPAHYTNNGQFIPNSTSSSCRFVLPQPIVNCLQVRTISFTYANTLYNVRAPNNTLIFNTNYIDPPNPNYMTITVPDGYYTIEKLADTINGLLVRHPEFFRNIISAPSNPVEVRGPNSFLWTIHNNVLVGRCVLHLVWRHKDCY